MLRVTIHDDRGVAHRVPLKATDTYVFVDPLLWRNAWRYDPMLERYRQHREWEMGRAPDRNAAAVMASGIPLVSGFTVLCLFSLSVPGTPIDTTVFLMIGLIWLIIAAHAVLGVRERRYDSPSKRKRRARRAEPHHAFRARPSICIACRFDLRGLEPEADGCTVCPECGAAWRVGEVPPPGKAPPIIEV